MRGKKGSVRRESGERAWRDGDRGRRHDSLKNPGSRLKKLGGSNTNVAPLSSAGRAGWRQLTPRPPRCLQLHDPTPLWQPRRPRPSTTHPVVPRAREALPQGRGLAAHGVACSEAPPGPGVTPISRAAQPDMTLRAATASHHVSQAAARGQRPPPVWRLAVRHPRGHPCRSAGGAAGGAAGPGGARGGSRLPGGRGLARRRHRDERQGRWRRRRASISDPPPTSPPPSPVLTAAGAGNSPVRGAARLRLRLPRERGEYRGRRGSVPLLCWSGAAVATWRAGIWAGASRGVRPMRRPSLRGGPGVARRGWRQCGPCGADWARWAGGS